MVVTWFVRGSSGNACTTLQREGYSPKRTPIAAIASRVC